MSPVVPILITLLLIAAGAFWTLHVDSAPVMQQLLRIEVGCAFALSAFVILSPLWNATIQTAVHSGYRASTMFTIVPALALPVIMFPGAAAYVLRFQDTQATQTLIKSVTWLLLAVSLILTVTL